VSFIFKKCLIEAAILHFREAVIVGIGSLVEFIVDVLELIHGGRLLDDSVEVGVLHHHVGGDKHEVEGLFGADLPDLPSQLFAVELGHVEVGDHHEALTLAAVEEVAHANVLQQVTAVVEGTLR
jgi:hypothetical protein